MVIGKGPSEVLTVLPAVFVTESGARVETTLRFQFIEVTRGQAVWPSHQPFVDAQFVLNGCPDKTPAIQIPTSDGGHNTYIITCAQAQ